MAPDTRAQAQAPSRSERATPLPASAPIIVDTLHVRIASQDRRDEVRVSGTALGVQVFQRDGAGVRSSAGGRSTSLEVSALPGGEGLGVAGRLYSGSLLIEAHGARGLRVTNIVHLEDYIAGVVPAELVLWSAEPAEIEAQAIAARTYALRSITDRRSTSREAFLWDDTRDQVYLGIFSAGTSGGARKVQTRLERALERSRGQLLLDERGALFDVRFHATCGGHTTTPARAFPNESRVTTGAVACSPCATIGAQERSWPKSDERRRQVHWTWTASRADLDELAASLGLGRHLQRIQVGERDDYGRWLTVKLEGESRTRTIDVTRLRAELDPARLKSGLLVRTWPVPGELITGGLLFEGLGRGHGAGLCQIGSHELAGRGWTARRILSYYLSGARLANGPTTLSANRP